MEFPLRETHVFRLCCPDCLQRRTHFLYQLTTVPQHQCSQTMLMLRPRKLDNFWLWVRERRNHRPFQGYYVLCRYFMEMQPCMVEESLCSFAHNKEEQFLWMLEKDGSFNIQEFILTHRAGSNKVRTFTSLFRILVSLNVQKLTF